VSGEEGRGAGVCVYVCVGGGVVWCVFVCDVCLCVCDVCVCVYKSVWCIRVVFGLVFSE
jgi:hypothetical protein